MNLHPSGGGGLDPERQRTIEEAIVQTPEAQSFWQEGFLIRQPTPS